MDTNKLEHLLEQAKIFCRKYRYLLLAILCVVMIALPYVITSDYIRGVTTRILMYMLFASAINAANGYTGQMIIGFIGFITLGSYTTAILTTRLEANFFLALLAAGLVAAAGGALLSGITRKLSGMYLSLVTAGFAEIVRIICLNWDSLTGGARGIKAIPSPSIFGISLKSSYFYYFFTLAVLVLMVFCTSRVLKSRVGRAWMSIRENPAAAASLGIELGKYKIINLAYSAFWAGIGGGILAAYYHYIDTTMFTMDESLTIVTMSIIGGLGTLSGPILGAFVVQFLNESLRFASEFRMVIYALLIIVMMWVRPQGLLGNSDSALSGATRKKRRPARKNRTAVPAGK